MFSFFPPLTRVLQRASTGAACLLASITSVHAQVSEPVAPKAEPAAAAQPRFAIFEYVVSGNTVLQGPVIERAVYPFLGEGRSIDDVESARAALEKAYRDNGFGTVGVDIPEQRADSGSINLIVVEGRVSRLRVSGSRYFSQGHILEKVPSVAEGAVPNFGTLQAELAEVNRTADRRVTPLLRPGRAPGTTEVDLQVEDKLPIHGGLEINNRNSPNTSRTRAIASLRLDNLWQRDHSLSVQAQTSPEKTEEVSIVSAAYTLPAGVGGKDSVNLSLIHSDSTVVTGVGSTTVFGRGRIYGLRYNAVIALTEQEYHSISAGLDYKDVHDAIDAGDPQSTASPVRYVPWSVNYLGTLNDTAGRWQLGAGVTVGIRSFFSSDSQFADKRYLASSGFSVLKADVGRDQRLPWGLTMAGRLAVQWSGTPLISNEQFVVGGVDTVRGYLESSAAGDRGARASLELRSPELAPADTPWLGELKAHAFVEGAALQLIEPLPGQTSRFRLMSTGMGLRLKSASYASLALDLAWPLLALGSVERGQPRLHATGSVDF